MVINLHVDPFTDIDTLFFPVAFQGIPLTKPRPGG